MSQTSYRVSYQFNQQQREHQVELELPHLSVSAAALRLLELHFGDAEINLVMPSADAAPEQILRQAMLMGITHIEVDASR